jgi:hypothetical protein
VLIIREEQYEALAQLTRNSSHEQIAAYLRAHAPPAKSMSDPDLYGFISRQEVTAKSYGFGTVRQIAKWSWLALIAGETFHENSHVRGTLNRPDISNLEARLDVVFVDVANRRKSWLGRGT